MRADRISRRRNHEPGGYWTTTREVMETLGMTRGRVAQLVNKGKLSAMRGGAACHELLFRRRQLE